MLIALELLALWAFGFGAVAFVLLGDLIVCIFMIGLIVKFIKSKKNKQGEYPLILLLFFFAMITATIMRGGNNMLEFIVAIVIIYLLLKNLKDK